MSKRILIYILPLILVLVEQLLLVISEQSGGFSISSLQRNEASGPALVAAGLGILLTLTDPKDKSGIIEPELREALKAKGLTAIAERDKRLISRVWLLFFLLLCLWFTHMYLNHNDTSRLFNLISGLIAYGASVVLSEWKGFL